MKERQARMYLLVVAVLFISGFVYASDVTCEVPDNGCLTPNQFKTKLSLTHYWQGAVNGVNTKNSDRMAGLCDLDLCYLLAAEQMNNNMGDYAIIAVSSQTSFGNGVDGKVGSFFDINDGAKGDNSLFIDKLFVEFTAMDRLFTFNVGKIDLIDYFDHSAVANEYKDQFFAYPLVQTANIPFPSKGLGVRIQWDPSEYWYVQAAVADAQAAKRETGFRTTYHNEDHFFSMGEIGVRPNFFDLSGTYRFMVWYDPQDKSYLDGSSRTKRDDLGFAVSFDQKLNDKFTAFFRYGWADDKVNQVEDFVSFGGQIEGLFEGRDEDVFAVGYARGLRSPNGLSADNEREIDLIETYYSYKVNDNMKISPNIQFVMDPGGKKKESPATVFGLRCRMKF